MIRLRPHSTLFFDSGLLASRTIALRLHSAVVFLASHTRVEIRHDAIALRPHSTLALMAAPTRVEIRTNITSTPFDSRFFEHIQLEWKITMTL